MQYGPPRFAGQENLTLRTEKYVVGWQTPLVKSVYKLLHVNVGILQLLHDFWQ